jgi:hypothetical protein
VQPSGVFTVAPGLQNLSAVPNVSQVGRFGHVTVFAVNLTALGCTGP